MKKRAQKGRSRSTVTDESIHFRLCHLCLHLNESPHEINRCEKCGHDYYSVADYLMSEEEVELGDADDASEGGPIAERAKGMRYGRRLNGLVAIL